MANIIKIKRNATSAAPTSLSNAELAFSEANQKLYYGLGAQVIEIGGSGAFVTLGTPQTVTGAKTFDSPIVATLSGNATTATQLQNPRNFSLVGDVTAAAIAFNGSANVTLTTVLSSTGVMAGTYTKLSVDEQGRVRTATKASFSDLDSPVGTINFNNQRLTALALPASASDAATRRYVDDQVSAFLAL